jgi:hypothetical protein
MRIIPFLPIRPELPGVISWRDFLARFPGAIFTLMHAPRAIRNIRPQARFDGISQPMLDEADASGARSGSEPGR